MSYALQLVGDATADLRVLDPTMAEETLDELEMLASDPSSLREDTFGEAIFDFVRAFGDTHHTVFIRLHVDRTRSILTVLSIFDHVRGITG